MSRQCKKYNKINREIKIEYYADMAELVDALDFGHVTTVKNKVIER